MNKQLRGFLFLLLISLACLTLISYQALAGPKALAKGAAFPSIHLPVPEEAALKNYLGLAASGEFALPQIKAQALIIQVFSRY